MEFIPHIDKETFYQTTSSTSISTTSNNKKEIFKDKDWRDKSVIVSNEGDNLNVTIRRPELMKGWLRKRSRQRNGILIGFNWKVCN